MRSPFRAQRTAEASPDDSARDAASPDHPKPPKPPVAAALPPQDANRDRSDTGSSWPGSFRPEGPPPKPELAPVAVVIREETGTLVAYLLGATALHLACREPRPAAAAAAAAPHSGFLAAVLAALGAAAAPGPRFEPLLQAAWLYFMSTTAPAATVGAGPRPVQPLLAARIAAWGLGRLRRRQLGLIAAVHAAVWLLYGLLLARWWPGLVPAADDAGDNGAPWSPWTGASDALRVACGVVALYVGPPLLRLNRLPPGLVVLLLQPPPPLGAHRTAADSAALAASQVLGGLLAAHVLGRYFPDGPVY